MYMDCANPAGACWGDHLPCMLSGNYCTNSKDNAPPRPLPPAVVAGRWYCFEIMADAGTPTTDTGAVPPRGVLDFWVDGVEYGPFENLWLATSASVKPTIIYLSLFNHDTTHSVEGIMVDDVVAATSPIGPRRATGVQRQASPRILQEFAVSQRRDGRIAFRAGHRPHSCELFVYDISGKQAWSYAPAAGAGRDEWLAPALVPGVYLASLRFNNKTIVKKAVLVR
jgi:hypothetical protein